MAVKLELKPGVFINTSVLYVRISRLPYSVHCNYEILSTSTLTEATDAGNLQSVHWGKRLLNTFKGLAEKHSGFLISIFILTRSTGDVPEACGSKGHTNIFF